MEKEIVYREAGEMKSTRGTIRFDDGFIDVTDGRGRKVFVNNRNIVYIRDLEG